MPVYLRMLTDRELARVAESSLDPIFSSDLERELTRRFVRSIVPQNESGAVQAIVRQIDGHLKNVHELAYRDTKFDAPVSEIERLVRELAQIAQGDE